VKQALHELPNPFLFTNGNVVCTAADWERRRHELLELVVGIEYGGMPPTPVTTRAEELHALSTRDDGARLISLRVLTDPDDRFSFMLYLLIPPGPGPFPVVLNGDACWQYATEAVTGEIIRRGCIFAQFNRVEIAPDNGQATRNTGLYRVYPGDTFGALAAWAWGYHRCVDVLVRRPEVAQARIGIVGHSRGGKAVLLAGATDTRIAFTAPNNSGCGGAGCYRWRGPDSETLAIILGAFPYWFGPRMPEYVGRESELPFDQHALKALVAPRALLTTEALGDLWANPTGTWQTHLAAREVYRFLGAEDQLAICCREGGHCHAPEDWRTFLDVMGAQCGARPPTPNLNRNPFPDLPPAFTWRAPASA